MRWVLDPIDGTVNYLYGLPDCAVSVAAEVDGEVVAGAVVTIPTGVEYAAALGHGATRDGLPDLASGPRRPWPSGWCSPASATSARCASTRPAASPRCCPRSATSAGWARAPSTCATWRTGAADGYVEAGPQAWDWSAGGLVLSEAGGRFELLDGIVRRSARTRSRNVVVGAPADGWDDFVAALAEAGFLA